MGLEELSETQALEYFNKAAEIFLELELKLNDNFDFPFHFEFKIIKS